MESDSSTGNLTSKQEQDPRLEKILQEKKMAAREEKSTVPDDWKPLPVDRNYKGPGYRMYRYRGTIATNFHLRSGLEHQLAEFRGRSSDILVASFPKSGTTWLQEIVWHVTHRDGMANGKGTGVPLEFRFPVLEVRPHEFMKMPSLGDLPDPRFIKTHLHYHMLPESVFTSGAKVLYVSRDVRDVCVSFYHYSRMTKIQQYRGTFLEFRDSFMRDAVLYGPYREHVKGYLEHSDTVLCLTYEQMHQDRASVVRKVAVFLGVVLTDADVDNIVENTSFEVMKRNPDTNFQQWEKNGMIQTDESTFMRKGVVGDWKNYFTEEENEAFMKWRNEEVQLL